MDTVVSNPWRAAGISQRARRRVRKHAPFTHIDGVARAQPRITGVTTQIGTRVK
jgi:hypothetical protein